MNLLISVFVFFISQFNVVQKDSKEKFVDELLRLTKTRESAEVVINSIIRKQVQNKPKAPSNIEFEIKKSINYETYLNQVKRIYYSNYSELELKELIKIYREGDFELFKSKTQKIEKPIYDVGLAFGKDCAKIINDKLKNY
ncbi:hypothetical protein MYP_3003 [Sporocytophaga myxococcoides]|uniref:DUF2059 domain-containing protein n=1 Tax=Sporocytophaga myxococcoides TaxID=153721 RepID=A0A098LH59_9BACT|nr:hypothetical protein [Sporocytophaga myxococcoides]GAL85774.1 hypothetical protein MYP_3003 [Sporocytophaga myxococcoides]